MNTIFKKELSLEMVDFPASYFRLQEGVQFDQIDRLGLGQVSSLLGYIMEVMAEPMAAHSATCFPEGFLFDLFTSSKLSTSR